MRSTHATHWMIGRGAVVCLLTLLAMGPASAQQASFANERGVEVLMRGPVHEAFATLAKSDTAPGPIFLKGPPDEIEELPPGRRPDGDNVAWIPGYWSWDDDRDDYIWLSGVWRDVPPNRQWVPGYWRDTRGGSQFVSGFWSDVSRNEIDYLPAPPAPLEMGAGSPRPGSGQVWVPGSWVWLNTRYAWQPGYWVAEQPNWVWTPAHYVWTPRGYAFVSGYWDYDIDRRGMMFAPVYYSSPVYQRPNYNYSPSIAIDLASILGHFFVRSNSRDYYYGDYYDDRYLSRGYEPWYSRYDRYDRDELYHFDPLYTSYRSQQIRRDRDWDKHVEEQYAYRRAHVEARPPRTFSEYTEAPREERRGDDRQARAIARPLDQVVTGEAEAQQLRPVEEDRRKEFQSRSRDVKKFRAERKQIEEEPDAAPEVARDRAPAPPKAGTERPARETSRGQPEPKKAAAESDTGRERGRHAEGAKPVRKSLRASPIASRKAAPPPPDIPKPVAEPEAASQKHEGQAERKPQKGNARNSR